MTVPGGLAWIEHIVVLMLDNRSFDHMLGYLYSEHANVSPRGDAFEGLTGNESCPDENSTPVPVFPITPTTENAYFMPGADPGEGFAAANAQLFGTETPVAGTKPTNQGFVNRGLGRLPKLDHRAASIHKIVGHGPMSGRQWCASVVASEFTSDDSPNLYRPTAPFSKLNAVPVPTAR